MSDTVGGLLKTLARLLAARGVKLAKRIWGSGYSNFLLVLAAAGPYVWRSYWFLHENWGLILEGTIRGSKILQALSYIASFFTGLFRKKKPDRDVVQLESSLSYREPESIIQGSVEQPSEHRDWELIVFNSQQMATGKGIRVFDALVLPAHVFHAALTVGNVVEIGSATNKDRYLLDITMHYRYDLESDLMGIAITEPEWSKLAVKKTNIGVFTTSVMVTITGVRGKGTMGRLTSPRGINFGCVKYDATTTNGYSGASYCNGGHAMAMHMSGNPNMGFAVDYVRALVKFFMMSSAEGSDRDTSLDFANKEFYDEEGELKSGVTAAIYGYDDVRIKYQGQYHILDKNALRDKLGARKYDALVYADRESVFPERPSHGASKKSILESVLPAKPGTSGTAPSSAQSQKSQGQSSQSLSKTQLTRIKWLTSTSPEEITRMIQLARESQA